MTTYIYLLQRVLYPDDIMFWHYVTKIKRVHISDNLHFSARLKYRAKSMKLYISRILVDGVCAKIH